VIANSSLYVGAVIHRRIRPRRHALRFRAFWLLLDLDEIDTLARQLRLFSRNRWNAVSFHDADHGDGSATPLRAQVERHLREAGLHEDGCTISLLCMPRIFGYGFNPISVYFCRTRSGALTAILYQVHNTFGQRHSYLIPATQLHDGVIDQSCDKDFYVSPFLGMKMRYAFRVEVPGSRVSVRIEGADNDGPLIVAALAGVREDLTDAALRRVLVTHPLLTLKVIAGIHWHALKMVLKGFRLQDRPATPDHSVTIVRADR
jgi:DUF1365 family protein